MINEKRAKIYCKEDLSKIKNYDLAIADTTQVWDCHHMTETWWGCSKKDLIENECYYNRKACELIFLTHAEHISLHAKNRSEESLRKMSEAMKGRTFSEESLRKMSEAMKGRTSNRKGVTLSNETRKKMSEAHKGMLLSEEHRKKISAVQKGKHRSEETKQKISDAQKCRLAKAKENRR